MEDFVLGIFKEFKVLYDRCLKISSTPGMPGICLQKIVGEVIKYREYCLMVMKILYFVKKVSPVCANACCKLSQHCDSPCESHWCMVEHLLGSLRNDPENQKLKMRPPMELHVHNVMGS